MSGFQWKLESCALSEPHASPVTATINPAKHLPPCPHGDTVRPYPNSAPRSARDLASQCSASQGVGRQYLSHDPEYPATASGIFG